MAFDINTWSTVSSAANLDVTTLQDGSYTGTPGNHTYISASDTVATISAADYFNTVAVNLHIYDRIYAIGTDGIVDLRVTSVTFGPTAVTTTATLGLGDVNGPVSSLDNEVTRFDGITGKVIQGGSSVLLSDAGAMTALTSLTVDNLNLNGNALISEDVNGNISLTPNGTGLNVLANAQVTNVTASRAVVTDASSNLNESTTTATEIGYVNGVTSAIQTQLNALKAISNIASVAQGAHSFVVGELLYLTAGVYTKAQANAVGTADVVGIVKEVVDVGNFVIQFGGIVTGLAGLTSGQTLYLSPGTPGAVTNVKTVVVGEIVKPVMVAATTTTAYWTNQLGVLN